MTTTRTAPPTTSPTSAQATGPAYGLRTILRIDAWSTALFGVVLLAAGGVLREPLGLPQSWSVPFGVAMLGGAAALALIAGYPEVPSRLALTVVVANALSAVAMIVILLLGVIPLTGLGVAFMLVGAAVVAVYAALEYHAQLRAT